MAITAKLYGNFFLNAMNKDFTTLDGTDTLKFALLTSSYTPDQDADVVFADISANQLVDPSYPAGGMALTGVTVTRVNKVVTLDSDDVTFLKLSGTFRYGAIYDTVSDDLIAYVNYGADVVPTAQNFTTTMSASGISTHTAT